MKRNYVRDWAPVPDFYDPLMAGSIDGTDDEPHDRAVARALNAAYKPNKQVAGEAHNTVFVSRLDPLTNEDSLTTIFSRYGQIKRLRLVKDIVTGMSKRYAFIEYTDRRAADRAQREANKATVDGRVIFVDFELERVLHGWVPRRLGGGFGGNKQSGQLRFGGKDRPFKKPIVLDNSLCIRPRTEERLNDGCTAQMYDRSYSHHCRSKTPEPRAVHRSRSPRDSEHNARRHVDDGRHWPASHRYASARGSHLLDAHHHAGHAEESIELGRQSERSHATSVRDHSRSKHRR